MKRPKGPARRKWRWLVTVLGGVRWVVPCHPYRGCFPPVATPLCAYCGCEACQEAGREIEMYKKPVTRAVEQGVEFARVESPKMLSKLPTITEVLVQPSWEDGETKGERGLFVFVSATLVKLLLKLERPPVKLMVSGRTWDEAWAALELVLKSPEVPWEQDAPRDQRGVKKKK